MQLCTLLLHFSLSDAIKNMSFETVTKRWTVTEVVTILCEHRDPVYTFVPEYKLSTLYSGTGTVSEF